MAGSRELIDKIRPQARSFIFTASPLAPCLTAAALKAVEMVSADDSLVKKLWENREFFILIYTLIWVFSVTAGQVPSRLLRLHRQRGPNPLWYALRKPLRADALHRGVQRGIANTAQRLLWTMRMATALWVLTAKVLWSILFHKGTGSSAALFRLRRR